MRRGSTSGHFNFWTERLTPSTTAMLWALAAMKWRTRADGATYATLARMLGITHHSAFRRAVLRAEGTGLVKVGTLGRKKTVRITPAALRLLEETWTRRL